jgi:hypothetical protein
MAKLSKKEAEQQQQQQAKIGYWQNELFSLGILEPKQKKELNDDEEELENSSLQETIGCYYLA